MNELQKSDRASSREKYEKLLLERDALRKEAAGCLTLYIREFGELINRVFEKKIDCISKKKSIAFCQAAVNRGKPVNVSELQEYIDVTMSEYNARLARMIEDCKSAKKAGVSSEYDCVRSKTLYRRIAKLIHPDICPEAWAFPEIAELWDRTLTAYGMNGTEELSEIEILVHRVLDDNGFEPGALEIDSIDERIGQVEAEIMKIISTDPYLYKELLEDPSAVEVRKKELEEEYEAYARYAEELEKTLKQLLMRGVVIECQEN
ncbi:MAG: hypothetical protein HUJ66_03085 [Oscillospiraceae bacterium]|nr:hypothetical protein [Oscillospiraceae bacterium]